MTTGKFIITLALVAIAASAATIKLDNPSGNVGTSQTYCWSGYCTTAYGFSSPGHAEDLYGVANDGNGNSGLGLAGDPEHEVDGSAFIQFTSAGLHDIAVTFSSLDDDECFRCNSDYEIFGSNVKGSAGTTLLASGIVDGPNVQTSATFTDSFAYFTVIHTGSDDMLVQSITAGTSGVPEPSSGTLGAIGLGAMVLMGSSVLRKRR